MSDGPLTAAAMLDAERRRIAEGLLALAFSLRGNDNEEGQAWLLSLATTVMARAILGSVGPMGDPEELLALSSQAVRDTVAKTQSDYIRNRLTGARN